MENQKDIWYKINALSNIIGAIIIGLFSIVIAVYSFNRIEKPKQFFEAVRLSKSERETVAKLIKDKPDLFKESYLISPEGLEVLKAGAVKDKKLIPIIDRIKSINSNISENGNKYKTYNKYIIIE